MLIADNECKTVVPSVVIHINVFPSVLVNCENLAFYQSVGQLEYLKAHYQLFLRSWKKLRFLTNLQ